MQKSAHTLQKDAPLTRVEDPLNLRDASIEIACPVCGYLQLLDATSINTQEIHCVKCLIQLELLQLYPLELTWCPKDGFWRE